MFTPAGRRGAIAGLAAGLAVVTAACGGDDGILRTPDGSVISTSVTRMAGVDVVTPDRNTVRTCLAATTADPGRSNPQRIIVTDPALLDALCALGMGGSVVAVTVPDAAGADIPDRLEIPAYLGPELTALPRIGTSPDVEAVRTADADLVLTTPDTEDSAIALRDSGALGDAPVTEITDDDWVARFTAVAEAVGRSAAGADRLAEFRTEAQAAGRRQDAASTQVSLVRFLDSGTEVLPGTDSFAGQILAIYGAQRPAPQRGPDAVEVGDANFADADGDIIYVGFQESTVSGETRSGLDRGEEIMGSDRWLDLGAPSWRRVFAVDDEIWFGPGGLSAAWLVLNDLKNTLNSASS